MMTDRAYMEMNGQPTVMTVPVFYKFRGILARFSPAMVISDGILVLLPLWILCIAKIDAILRLRLLIAFTVSMATTLVGIARSVVSSVVGGIPSLACGALEVNLVTKRLDLG